MEQQNNNGYSREAYEATSGQLEELQLDRETIPEGYDTTELDKAIENTRARLKGLLTIAHKEALAMDLERELEPLRPALDHAIDDIKEKLSELSDAPAVLGLGHAVVKDIVEFEDMIYGNKRPLPVISRIEERLSEVREEYLVFMQKANGWLMSQDRYGHGLDGPHPA